MEQIEQATAQFVSDNPEFLAFDTDDGRNFEILRDYIEKEWPNSAALANAECWQIAFIACKGELTPIRGYVFVPDQFREDLKMMPQSQIKERYRDPEFKRLYDAIALEEFDSSGARIPSTPHNPWKYLTAEEWVRMDATKRANLYAHEILFREAVQQLIDKGQI
jgi:hypothetical protein